MAKVGGVSSLFESVGSPSVGAPSSPASTGTASSSRTLQRMVAAINQGQGGAPAADLYQQLAGLAPASSAVSPQDSYVSVMDALEAMGGARVSRVATGPTLDLYQQMAGMTPRAAAAGGGAPSSQDLYQRLAGFSPASPAHQPAQGASSGQTVTAHLGAQGATGTSAPELYRAIEGRKSTIGASSAPSASPPVAPVAPNLDLYKAIEADGAQSGAPASSTSPAAAGASPDQSALQAQALHSMMFVALQNMQLQQQEMQEADTYDD